MEEHILAINATIPINVSTADGNANLAAMIFVLLAHPLLIHYLALPLILRIMDFFGQLLLKDTLEVDFLVIFAISPIDVCLADGIVLNANLMLVQAALLHQWKCLHLLQIALKDIR